VVGSRSAKKKPYGLPVLAAKPGRLVIVCPEVVGSPVPTGPRRTADPDESET